MTAEQRAEAMVELVDRGNGYQSMRLRGQGGLLWHSGDAGLMEERRRETVAAIAAAIREAVAAEQEKWAAEVERQSAMLTRLLAELKRVAPLLAMRGAAGYSFGPVKPTEDQG